MIKDELDLLKFKLYFNEFKIQQLGVELEAFGLELKKQREIEQLVVSPEETQNPEGNEVNFDLPPRFDEYEEEETTEEENRRMRSMVVQEKIVEKTENPSKLHKHIPPHTFPDKPGVLIPTHPVAIHIPRPPFPTIPSKLPPKSPHNQSIQSSLFHTHDQPPLRVLNPFREWKNLAPIEWKAQSVEDKIFKWLILVFGLSTALTDYQD